MDNEMSKDLEKKYDEILGTHSSPRKPLVDQITVEDEEDFVDPRETIKLTSESNVTHEQEDGETSTESEDNEKYEDIPDNLIAAGREYGFDDEEIVDLAENNPRYLEKLARAYEDVQTAKAQRVQPKQEFVQTEAEPEEKVIPKLDYLNVGDLSELDSSTRSFIEKLVASDKQKTDMINQAMEQINSLDEYRLSAEQREEIDFSRRLDNYFDKVDGCPELGNSANLNQSQRVLRQRLYGFAAIMQETGHESLEDALGNAVAMHRGLNNSEDRAEANVIKKINKTKKKFSPRPGGQKTTKKYKDDEEKVLDRMTEVGREMGLDW